jgi:hypothetical protein
MHFAFSPLHLPRQPPDAGSLVWRGLDVRGMEMGYAIEDLICCFWDVWILQKKSGLARSLTPVSCIFMETAFRMTMYFAIYGPFFPPFLHALSSFFDSFFSGVILVLVFLRVVCG